jgi:hypothetical protein
MSTPSYFYQVINPATRVNRNGKRYSGSRSAKVWQDALTGHCRMRHGGEFDSGCAACVEMKTRLDERVGQRDEQS